MANGFVRSVALAATFALAATGCALDDEGLDPARDDPSTPAAASADDAEAYVAYPEPCDLGPLEFTSACGIASATTSQCVGGGPLYQKKFYYLEVYRNGRVRGSTVVQTLYSCGPTSSDAGCSSVCYGSTPPEVLQ